MPVTEKPRKRGVSKFLSILNCCSSHENANKVESAEKVVPADQAKVLRQMRENQTTPVVKPNASVENSSAEESKEVEGENIGGPQYSEHKPAAQPTTMSQPVQDKSQVEQIQLQTDSGSKLDEKQGFDNTVARDELRPSVPVPNTPATPDDRAAPLQQSAIEANDREDVVPSQASYPDNAAAHETIVVKDSTPRQEPGDTDVIMAEAVPVAPVPVEQPKSREARTDQVPMSLPPPPPRTAQTQAAVGVGRSQSNAVAPSERPPWLLPPLQSRFHGKKCLVLDLDETLVHSSFKVYSLDSPNEPDTDVGRHFIRPISQSPLRLKVNITMCMLLSDRAWISS